MGDHYSGVRPLLSPAGPPQTAGPVSDAGQPAHSLLSRRGELQGGLLEQGGSRDQEQHQEPGGPAGLQPRHQREQQALAEPHHQKYRHVSSYSCTESYLSISRLSPPLPVKCCLRLPIVQELSILISLHTGMKTIINNPSPVRTCNSLVSFFLSVCCDYQSFLVGGSFLKR